MNKKHLKSLFEAKIKSFFLKNYISFFFLGKKIYISN